MKKIIFATILSLLSQYALATHGPVVYFETNSGNKFLNSSTTENTLELSKVINEKHQRSDCLIGVGAAIKEAQLDRLVDDIKITITPETRNYLDYSNCEIRIESKKLTKVEINYSSLRDKYLRRESWSYNLVKETLEEFARLSTDYYTDLKKTARDAATFVKNVESSRAHKDCGSKCNQNGSR